MRTTDYKHTRREREREKCSANKKDKRQCINCVHAYTTKFTYTAIHFSDLLAGTEEDLRCDRGYCVGNIM